LVELEVSDCQDELLVGEITQPVAGKPKEDWQVPYKEYLLDFAGEKVLSEEWETFEPKKLSGSFRMTFFFHYLKTKESIRTQFGEVSLPKVTKMPKRLRAIKYTDVD
jgi:hypothetical protein